MPLSIGNSGCVTLTGLQLPSLAPNLAHFLATESGTPLRHQIRLRLGLSEQAVVKLAGGGAGGDPELVAQALAELAINIEGFGQVVLCG